MELKVYRCATCGKMMITIKESGVPVICCGKVMEEVVAGTSEASLEKHIPVYNREGNLVKVNVGSIDHPMLEEHYIEWVLLLTNNGYQIKYLSPNDKPHVEFSLIKGEDVEAVYAYCNLHDLWKA